MLKKGKTKAPAHSLLGGFQPKPYHIVSVSLQIIHKERYFLPNGCIYMQKKFSSSVFVTIRWWTTENKLAYLDLF